MKGPCARDRAHLELVERESSRLRGGCHHRERVDAWEGVLDCCDPCRVRVCSDRASLARVLLASMRDKNVRIKKDAW